MYDVPVMGAGPAGIAAAERAARLGAKVCLLDARRAGGTDAVSGVVPARTLAQIAQLKRTADDLGRYGIKVGTPKLDFGSALGRCREVIEEVHASKEVLARDLGKGQAPDVFECVGEARFVDPQRVVLPNGRVLEADAYILCTGGHPRRPDFPGSALSLVPSDLWQPGAKLPSSAVILGTGHTGVQVVQLVATGMATGLRVEQLAAVDLAYPTYVQIVGEAAYRICLALGIELHETLVPNTQGAAVASPKIALRGSNMPCFI